METAISASSSSQNSQQNSQTDLINLLAADVNNRQLMAVSLLIYSMVVIAEIM